jgi:hypothetical protein
MEVEEVLDDVWVLSLGFLVEPWAILQFGSTCKRFQHLVSTQSLVWVEMGRRRWHLPVNDITPQLVKTILLLESGNCHLLLLTTADASQHKPLPLVAVSSSAEDYSEGYSLANLAQSVGPAYCTKDVPTNVDVILQLGEVIGCENPSNLLMFLTHVDIRPPISGYVRMFRSKRSGTLALWIIQQFGFYTKNPISLNISLGILLLPKNLWITCILFCCSR